MTDWNVKQNARLNAQARIICAACKQSTKHRILASFDRRAVNDDFLHMAEQYEILECCGCEAIAFRQDWQCSEETFCDPETGESEEIHHEEVFPHRLPNRSAIREAHFLPGQIGPLYTETLSALLAHQRVLAGIGMRILIEAVCAEQGAQGRNLKDRIDWLKENRILSSADADILQGLRVMGNAAAHEVKPHKDRELSDAFDVIEHLLTGVYILPARARINAE